MNTAPQIHPEQCGTGVSPVDVPPATRSRFFTLAPLHGIVVILALLLAAVAPSRAMDQAGAAAAFQKANQAYEQAEYADAQQGYQSIVDAGLYAPDLFFNLGNAAFRLEQPGEATLRYRQALVLDPAHAEARQNLKLIEIQTGFIAARESGWERFVGMLSSSQIHVLITIGFWGLVLSGAWLLVRRPVSSNVRTGLILTLFLSVTVLAVFGAALRTRGERDPADRQAIVIAPDAYVRASPATEAKKIISLPPGSIVTTHADRQSWTYIGTGDEDLRGWVRSDEVSPVWPYDSSFLE